jgi:hypothetical protein
MLKKMLIAITSLVTFSSAIAEVKVLGVQGLPRYGVNEYYRTHYLDKGSVSVYAKFLNFSNDQVYEDADSTNDSNAELFVAISDGSTKYLLVDLGVRGNANSVYDVIGKCQTVVDDNGKRTIFISETSQLDSKAATLNFYLVEELEYPLLDQIDSKVCIESHDAAAIKTVLPSVKPFLSWPISM